MTNTDDDVFTPETSITIRITDRAVLTFASDLDILGGAGTFRLRIGTDEEFRRYRCRSIWAGLSLVPVLARPQTSRMTSTRSRRVAFWSRRKSSRHFRRWIGLAPWTSPACGTFRCKVPICPTRMSSARRLRLRRHLRGCARARYHHGLL